MKILVYGAGAVGGYLGARLLQSGHEVTLVVREVMAEAIESYGLIVTQDNKREVTHPQIVTSILQAIKNNPQYDLVILGMKTYDLKSALDPLVAFCPNPAMVLTTQNGIGVEKLLMNQFGAEHVLAGSFTIALSKETTNHITAENEGGFGIAPTQPGQKIKEWVKLFNDAGVNTVGVKDYQSMKWSKALLNIVGNASSAILNRPPGVIYKSNAMFELEMRMIEETLEVMAARKLKVMNLPGWSSKQLAFSVKRLPQPLIKPFLANIVSGGRGEKMPSFYIDLNSGKGKNEVLFHNGAIARAGRAVNIAAPVNAAYSDVLTKIAREEFDWREFDGKPKRLYEEVRRWEKALR